VVLSAGEAEEIVTEPAYTGTPRLAIFPPEKVPLLFTLPPVGTRIAAFTIDCVIVVGALLVLGLLALWAGAAWGGGFLMALLTLASLGLQSFYFAFFELRWQGRTPGKRLVATRVVARDGGPLTAGMVFARNLMRLVELFIPAMLLIAPEIMLSESAPVPVRAACLGWVTILLLFPLFNKGRCRVGDLVAGTLVVAAPEAHLDPDLVEQRGRAAESEFGFTRRQLDVYGIHELHVLEDVLRQEAPEEALLETIADRICRKIGVDRADLGMDAGTFLRRFYKAQRRRLEEKILMGTRQETKKR